MAEQNQNLENFITGASLNANYVSPAFRGILGQTIQAIWTGSPVGTFTLEWSNKFDTPTLDADFTNYTNMDQPAGGSANNFGWIECVGLYRWIRLKYTYTSGSGSLNVRLNLRDVNVRLT